LARIAKKTAGSVTAKELAEAAQETYNSIDHWSSRGLLVFTRSGRRRLYPVRQNLSRIRRIRHYQNRGYSLDAIRDRLSRGPRRRRSV